MTDGRDTRDDQYEAEVTDQDEIDVLDFPPERPLGLGDLLAPDVTAAGEYAPDDLRRRQLRLRPDVARADDMTGGPALSAPGDPYGPDVADEQVADRGTSDWDIVDPGARLADSPGADHRPVDSWPAEEAAIHLIDDRAPVDDPLPTFGAARAGAWDDEPRGRRR
jgi:hypothetical protein